MDRKINFFSSKNRDKLKSQLTSIHFDLIVIGGGITGSGICLDAVARGMKVCLIEMNDFASGTSSKSTKLIHGGLRYLEQFKFNLVHETGSERTVLYRLAPSIVKSEKMLLPIKNNGKLNKLSTSIALSIYDYLAGVRIKDKKQILSKKEIELKEPLLKKDGLNGGAIYSEYRTDDARLTIELLKKASKMGAFPINYIKANEFIIKEDKVCGINCSDTINGDSFPVFSSTVVNAAGPWVDDILKNENNKLILSKGVHIVVPYKKFPLKQSIYFDAIDNRMIFAIPRNNTTYIGTTDTKYSLDKNNIKILKSEVKYLLESVNNYFSIILTINDVISSWSGLRPLIKEEGKKVTEITRKDEIFVSDNGIITIAGGKLTGYRKMAERVIDMVIKAQNHKSFNKCITSNIKLYESENLNQIKKEIFSYLLKNNHSKDQAVVLYDMYGENLKEIIKISKTLKFFSKMNTIIISEFIYCFENEMCQKLLDFFSQRTGRVYFEIEKVSDQVEIIKETYKRLKNISEKEFDLERLELKNYINSITTFI